MNEWCSPRRVFRTGERDKLTSSGKARLTGNPWSEVGVIHKGDQRADGGSGGKESACNTGDWGSISGSGRSPGGGNNNPLQFFGLGNLKGRGAWWATVHGVARVGFDWATKPPPREGGRQVRNGQLGSESEGEEMVMWPALKAVEIKEVGTEKRPLDLISGGLSVAESTGWKPGFQG